MPEIPMHILNKDVLDPAYAFVLSDSRVWFGNVQHLTTLNPRL